MVYSSSVYFIVRRPDYSCGEEGVKRDHSLPAHSRLKGSIKTILFHHTQSGGVDGFI